MLMECTFTSLKICNLMVCMQGNYSISQKFEFGLRYVFQEYYYVTIYFYTCKQVYFVHFTILKLEQLFTAQTLRTLYLKKYLYSSNTSTSSLFSKTPSSHAFNSFILLRSASDDIEIFCHSLTNNLFQSVLTPLFWNETKLFFLSDLVINMWFCDL